MRTLVLHSSKIILQTWITSLITIPHSYGILVPLIFGFPFYLVTYMSIIAPVLKTSVSGAAALSAFRCMGGKSNTYIYLILAYCVVNVHKYIFATAIHGTSPNGVEADSTTFSIYFSSVVDVARDKNGRELKASMKEVYTYVKRFMGSYLFVGFMFSVIDAISNTPSKIYQYEASSLVELLNFRNLSNNFMIACKLVTNT